MTALGFRPAGEADVATVVALVQSAYRGDASRAGWTNEADFVGGTRIDADGVRAMLGGGQCLLLAERAGEVIACCHLRSDGPDCWFGLFAVAPGLQGQGIGDALLAQAECLAGERFAASCLRMKVIWLRDSLIDWYRRRGYAATGARMPFPYDDPRSGLPLRDDLHFIEMARDLAHAGAAAGGSLPCRPLNRGSGRSGRR